MKRDDNSLEEIDMLFSKGNSETTDDTGQDVQEFSSSIEFVVFVDKSVEAVSNGFSNHFSSGHELSIKPVEDIFQVFSFSRFF